MDSPIAYIPMDRRQALVRPREFPDRTQGAALFADISGFTPLTEALVLELGAQRGAEELTRFLNLIYDAVIDEVHRFGGSVIAFAGDAITCWFDGDNGYRATTSALAMQEAMRPFAALTTPGGASISLTMKAAVATGPARRFLVGDPGGRVLDALAGETLVRLAAAEHQAGKGEVIVDTATLAALDHAELGDRRRDPEKGEEFAVVTALEAPAAPAPWPTLDPASLATADVRPWLLPAVYERLQSGLGNFLAELRPTVALFLRFDGIDYDADDQAGAKLDGYMRWVQSIAARYDGTLIDLNIGDKGSYLYINFGAPQAHENDAERAAATALALRTPPAQLAFIGDVQIGISQGRMRAGAYGGANHRTYGVLGDEVNMAARLMMAATPGQILVSQSAYPPMAGRFVLDALPPIRVKGKRQPVAIFALTGERSSQVLQLTSPVYALPMIGRRAELDTALHKLAQAAAGHGQVIGIGGEAGIGKSRLASALIEAAQQQGFAIYGGECESYGVNRSYLVWQPIWRGIFGIDPTWPPTRQIERLTEHVTAIDPGLAPRLPLLDMVLQLEIPDNDLTASLDARLRKAAREGLLADCLVAAARAQPLLIVLEDCQWLDPLSHDLLEALAQTIAGLPVIFVYLFRPFEHDRLRAARVSTLPHHTLLTLSAFDAEEIATFVLTKISQLVGDGVRVPPALVDRIAARAEGNPFFLDELINYLHLQGIDFGDATALDRIALPDSVQRLVLSLVDRFSESQKITVKVASVIGRVFQAAWLWGVYPQIGDATRVRADLETLRRQELLLPAPGEPELTYFFRQVITQGVTYESLPFAVKSALHEQIGDFLEATYAGTLDSVLDLLAFHYDRSENMAKRRLYLRRAGEAAQSLYANDAAIDYFTRVLPLLQPKEHPNVLLRLGQVLDLIGQWKQAEERYLEALAASEALGDHATRMQAQIALGELERKQGRYAEAAAWYGRAHAVAEEHTDQPGLAKALICQGTLAAQQGDYAAAAAHYARSLAIRRALDDQLNVAAVLNNMAIVAQFEGDYARSQHFHEEALAIRRKLGNTWAIAMSLNNLGTTLLDRHEYAAAGAYLDEALTIQRAVGDKWAIANALNNLGNVRRDLGEFDAAQQLYAESLALNHALGDRRALAYLLEDIGLLAASRGRHRHALRLVGAASALRAAISSPLSQSEQETLDGRLHAAHATLGDEAVGMLAEGMAWPLAQAVEHARDAP
ncbi:MAG: tetratricopeptide repeat protein [Caldilineaceae bacterium]|nr:tetratricopeptide repeat protein [Caldilineaceae bacterium]